MMSEDRVDRLQNLGMVWDTSAAMWQHNYREAMRYYLDHGNLEVPVKYVTPSGFALGTWLGTQRAAYKAEQLTPEQTAQLEALGVTGPTGTTANGRSPMSRLCVTIRPTAI